MLFELSLCLISLGAGMFGGILGMANRAILSIPALTLLFGIDIHYAIGASLVSVIACSSGSAANFLENRLTNVRLAVLLEIGTTLGALTGVFSQRRVSGERFLYFLFALILLVSAYAMFHQGSIISSANPVATPPDPWALKLGLNSSYPGPAGKPDIPYNVGRVGLGMTLMYGAGAVSALLGIRKRSIESAGDGFGVEAPD